MMWLQAPNITCIHGFSTRTGGVSDAPYDSLNLGGSEDREENISKNRTLALSALGLTPEQLCYLKQVHGTGVRQALAGKQEGDALVSNTKGQVLAISVADCYPVLFEDRAHGVVAAAHAGWRGTVGKIVAKTIHDMEQKGAHKANIRVAIGQGISKSRFEVGEEVLTQFRQAGFSEHCMEGRYLDLAACLNQTLLESGILAEHIWTMQRCTFEPEFFSYRRDKGITGRMWGVISH